MKSIHVISWILSISSSVVNHLKMVNEGYPFKPVDHTKKGLWAGFGWPLFWLIYLSLKTKPPLFLKFSGLCLRWCWCGHCGEAGWVQEGGFNEQKGLTKHQGDVGKGVTSRLWELGMFWVLSWVLVIVLVSVSNCYKLGGLTQHRFILSVLEARSQKSRCLQGQAPSEGSSGPSVPCLC